MITPNPKEYTKIAYGTEKLHSPMIEIQSLGNTYKFESSTVERTAIKNYVEDRKKFGNK